MDFSPLTRHSRIALCFSGGKDSLAVTYLLREFWPKITFYHVDSGDLLPEVCEIVSMVESIVPHFRRINTDAKEWTARVGLPSDLVPTTNTNWGVATGQSNQRIVDRIDCCATNIMAPMHYRMVEDKIKLVIRGTKKADLAKLPAVSGDTGLGYELWLPIQEWSHADVFAYLKEVGAPICRVYEHRVNAPECATCPAWWDESRAAYLKKYHPDLFVGYMKNLKVVAAAIMPVWENLKVELEHAPDA